MAFPETHTSSGEPVRRFSTWGELLSFLKRCEVVRYHAPMQIGGQWVRAKAFKNGKVRVHTAYFRGSSFTADSGHLERFGYTTEENLPCGHSCPADEHGECPRCAKEQAYAETVETRP